LEPSSEILLLVRCKNISSSDNTTLINITTISVVTIIKANTIKNGYFMAGSNTVRFIVRGEPVEPLAAYLEPFDKLRANGYFA